MNLQPEIDNQQFIDIEKNLLPLFRQMTEDILAPYQKMLFEISGVLVIVK